MLVRVPVVVHVTVGMLVVVVVAVRMLVRVPVVVYATVGMVVVVVVVVAVRVGMPEVVRMLVLVTVAMVADAEALAQHLAPDRDDHHPREQLQPREHRLLLLGPHGALTPEQDQTEDEDGHGVGEGDDETQHDRVARTPSRAEEIGGDEALAVARGEGVAGAVDERERDEENQAQRRQLPPRQRLQLVQERLFAPVVGGVRP